MSVEYKTMFEDWKNRSDDFQNLLLVYENVNDDLMSWSEIYRRANALFKEKVWYPRSKASELDKAVVQEENYKKAVFALRKEHNFHLETLDDYNEKFKAWLKAYPATKKRPIVDKHGQNWSEIYKIFHKTFKEDVWNEYRDEMSLMRKEELNAAKNISLNTVKNTSLFGGNTSLF